MKKFFMFALAAVAMLSFSSCLSEKDMDLAPNQGKIENEGYGYISLNATTDEAVATRASITDFSTNTWYAKIRNSKEYVWGAADTWEQINSSLAVKPLDASAKTGIGTYTIEVCNYKTLADALAANSNYGAAWYNGTETGITVTAGSTAEPTVECGVPDNTELRVVAPSFAGTALYVTIEAGNPRGDLVSTWDKDLKVFNHDKIYFGATAIVYYHIDYTINGKTKRYPTTGSESVTMGDAGKYKTFTVSSNDNGTITLTITTGDFEDDNNPKTITFDAATGDLVP
jgi:hypothetical protein